MGHFMVIRGLGTPFFVDPSPWGLGGDPLGRSAATLWPTPFFGGTGSLYNGGNIFGRLSYGSFAPRSYYFGPLASVQNAVGNVLQSAYSMIHSVSNFNFQWGLSPTYPSYASYAPQGQSPSNNDAPAPSQSRETPTPHKTPSPPVGEGAKKPDEPPPAKAKLDHPPPAEPAGTEEASASPPPPPTPVEYTPEQQRQLARFLRQIGFEDAQQEQWIKKTGEEGLSFEDAQLKQTKMLLDEEDNILVEDWENGEIPNLEQRLNLWKVIHKIFENHNLSTEAMRQKAKEFHETNNISSKIEQASKTLELRKQFQKQKKTLSTGIQGLDKKIAAVEDQQKKGSPADGKTWAQFTEEQIKDPLEKIRKALEPYKETKEGKELLQQVSAKEKTIRDKAVEWDKPVAPPDVEPLAPPPPPSPPPPPADSETLRLQERGKDFAEHKKYLATTLAKDTVDAAKKIKIDFEADTSPEREQTLRAAIKKFEGEEPYTALVELLKEYEGVPEADDYQTTARRALTQLKTLAKPKAPPAKEPATPAPTPPAAPPVPRTAC